MVTLDNEVTLLRPPRTCRIAVEREVLLLPEAQDGVKETPTHLYRIATGEEG